MEYADLIWYAVAAVLCWICVVPARYWLGRMYLRQGVESLRKGDHDHAICCFSKSIEWRSLNAEAYYNRGRVHRAFVQDYQSAIDDFGRAIVIKRDFVEAYVARGCAYVESGGDRDLAMLDFERAIALAPDVAAAYRGRAWVWLLKSDHWKAREDLKRFRELGGIPEPELTQRMQEACGRRE